METSVSPCQEMELVLRLSAVRLAAAAPTTVPQGLCIWAVGVLRWPE